MEIFTLQPMRENGISSLKQVERLLCTIKIMNFG